jgi:hypothetical protein
MCTSLCSQSIRHVTNHAIATLVHADTRKATAWSGSHSYVVHSNAPYMNTRTLVPVRQLGLEVQD